MDALIFHWFSFSSFGYGGFDYPGGTWVTLAVILSIALTGLLLAIKFGNVNAPTLPTNLTWGMVYGAGAALIVLFVILKFWRITAAPLAASPPSERCSPSSPLPLSGTAAICSTARTGAAALRR